MNEKQCYVCRGPLNKSFPTAVVELPDGSKWRLCEQCANREFPGWSGIKDPKEICLQIMSDTWDPCKKEASEEKQAWEKAYEDGVTS